MDNKISMMDTLTIRTAAPFKNLFPIREELLNDIASDMKANGFDSLYPIVIWAGHKVTVVDGHTRLAAALKIGLTKVPIVLREFSDEKEALHFAIKSQSKRRNLTDAELMSCIEAIDKRNPVGHPSAIPSREGISGESAENTAKLLNISRSKVERLRAVNDHGTNKTKAAVAAGEMSINKAYNQTMRERKAKRSQASEAEKQKTPEEIRAERLSTMLNTISTKVKALFEQEVQNFPELRYTLKERNFFDNDLTCAIEKLIEDMIPLQSGEDSYCEEE